MVLDMKKRKNYSDSHVMELYERLESCDAVARESGISASTVRNVLVRHGIPRTHRHEKKKTYRQWSHKYCHAIVGILYNVEGMDEDEISAASGIPRESVRQILRRKYGVIYRKTDRRYKKDVDIDAIEREYMDGATTYELAERYGTRHETISKWMIARGHRRGKGCVIPNRKDIHDVKCATCGKVFSGVHNARYCSHRCKNRAAYSRRFRTDHKTRAERYGLDYDPTITVEKLYKRDGGICQICGETCDPNDKSWGSCGPMHPSIDHIVPMSRGGAHVWSNVQLAHHLCNARKQDNMEVAV